MISAELSARQLASLAKLRGVQLTYTGHDGRRVRASRDSLLAVITALGHPVDDAASIASEFDRAQAERASRVLEPVLVVGRDRRLTTPISLAGNAEWPGGRVVIDLEDGGVATFSLGEIATVADSADGRLELNVELVGAIPPGYHRLTMQLGRTEASALLLAPPRLPQLAAPEFGVFAPLYALRSAEDWGIGTYSDLRDFADWIGENGGTLAGTLPLFAGFTAPPLDPSPYLPVSRRFWNDLYVDVVALPEFAGSPAARELAGAVDMRLDISGPTVDYDAVVARKRTVMIECAAALTSQHSTRRDAFGAFVEAHPELDRYADFRAADEQVGSRWPQWSAAPAGLPQITLDPELVAFHRYAQFVASEQLAAAADREAGLYLDLPVGVHPAGFDTWSEPELFASAGVGAPPDGMFAAGQSWGFPPLHPERLRATGYQYLIESYRQVLAHARAIRIDHVLGLQRLFWIPTGGDATNGAYVRNYRDEILAVIAIEAARAGAVVVGEDLGVVPPGIRGAMDRDGMLHTWVWRFNASPDTPFPSPQHASVAALGSHDLPRFSSFWRAEDIVERERSGEIAAAAAVVETAERDALISAVAQQSDPPIPADSRGSEEGLRAGLATCLREIAAGDASYLMIDLADLELETIPDNRPGTGPEAGNWLHRLTRTLADIAADESVSTVLSDVSALRSAAVRKEQVA